MKRHKIFFTLLFHLFFGFLFGLFAYLLFPNGKQFNRFEFLLSAVITFASTFCGFTLTAVTVLMGYYKTKVMQAVNTSNAKRELVFRYCESMTCGFLLIVVCSIIGELTPQTNIVTPICIGVGIGSLTYYLTTLISSSYYLISLITLSAKAESQQDSKMHTPKNGFNF